MKNRNYIYVAVLASLAVVINIIENLFIPPVGFGIRFGLANIISLVSLKLFSIKEMLMVIFVRLTVGNLLKGTIFGVSFWIPASGLFLSSVAIIVMDKLDCSIRFTSMMSAIFHSIGQLLAVVYLYRQVRIAALLPMLIIVSLVAGTITGYISELVIRRFRH